MIPVWTLLARLRALRFRFCGFQVGTKCLLGRRVRMGSLAPVKIGDRVVFEDDVWIKTVSPSATVSIGDSTFLGRGVEIDAIAPLQIGSHVLIAPWVFITDHNHRISDRNLRIDEQGVEVCPVAIGDDVWLGAHAVVLPGVTIARGAVVGAGAVVTHNVGPYEIVCGVPGRLCGRRGDRRRPVENVWLDNSLDRT